MGFHYGKIGTSNMRTVKNFKVVKSEFYINNVNDWGYHEENITTFSNRTDAEWFCEDNVEQYGCLEVQQCFNEDDKVYVIATYTV